MGLIGETEGVFEFLREFFGLMPTAIRMLIMGAFGTVVFLAVLRSIRR